MGYPDIGSRLLIPGLKKAYPKRYPKSYPSSSYLKVTPNLIKSYPNEVTYGVHTDIGARDGGPDRSCLGKVGSHSGTVVASNPELQQRENAPTTIQL